MHVVPAGPTPCARGCMLVCARPRVRWACLCECAARALARPKQKLVKVAPGYLRKRVKVASQRDRHKMVKVSEGAENIPPPYGHFVAVRSSLGHERPSEEPARV